VIGLLKIPKDSGTKKVPHLRAIELLSKTADPIFEEKTVMKKMELYEDLKQNNE
jgi:hypothetical protein